MYADHSGAEILGNGTYRGGSSILITVCTQPHFESHASNWDPAADLDAVTSDAVLRSLVQELIDPRERRPDIHIFRLPSSMFSIDTTREYDDRAEVYIYMELLNLSSYELLLPTRLERAVEQLLRAGGLYGEYGILVEANSGAKIRFPRTTERPS